MSFDKSEINSKMEYPIIGQRHVQSLLLFFATVFGFALRVNISAAIVPLTKINSEIDMGPTYDWNSATRGLILSSFFWGYVSSQFPAGLLAQRFNAKIVLFLSMTLSGIVAILHPIGIEYGGWRLLLAFRIITGLTQGFVYPCAHTLMAKWTPSTERSFLLAATYSGTQVGVASTLATSGHIFASFGWSGIFYITGGATLIWALVYLWFGASEPAKSKYISKLEREYIESLTGSTKTENERLPVPWKALLTSLPFYALIVAQCGLNWGFYTFLTELPSYLDRVLEMNMKSNALFSALPYLIMWVVGLIVGPVSDFIVNRGIVKITTSRKIFNTIGQWIPMVCLIGLGYISKEQRTLTLLLFTISVGFSSACACGYLVNHLDLAPNFSGILMGIANCLANISSILAPLAVSAIVTNQEDSEQWRIVFFLNAGIYLLSNTFFIIYGSGVVQPWNNPINTPKKISLTNQPKKESTVVDSNAWTIESSIDNEKQMKSES